MLISSAYYTDKLGTAIKSQANNICPDGYSMVIKNQNELNRIVKAWNQGIDSHLEAITNQSSYRQTNNGVSFDVHPDEVHVLVRRLFESGNATAESLAIDICSTLDIELI